MQFLNTWQFNIVAYLVAIVGFNQLYKLAVKDAKKDGAATILLQLIASGISLLLIPLFPFQIPTEIKYYLLLLGASVFYAINDRLQTTVRKHLPVSEYAILSQISRVFLFIFGIIIFKEAFLLNKAVGTILVVLANILLVYKEGKFVINKHVWLTVLAMLSFSLAISIDIGISEQFNLPFYIFLTLFIPAIMLAIVEKLKIKDVLNELQQPSKKYYLATGTFWTLAIVFALRAFQLGEVTTLVPIRGAAVLMNVLVGSFVLGEKDNMFKKTVAAILILVGISIAI